MGISLAVPAVTGTMPGRLRGPWSRSPDQGRGSPPQFAGASLVREEILEGEGPLGPLRLGVVPPVRLGARARAATRLPPSTPRTEDSYLPWMGGSYAFHGRRDLAHLGAGRVSAFLPAPATRGRVSASTQNQALAALLFTYREVLGRDLPWLDPLIRARGAARLPVVLSREELRALLSEMGEFRG